MVTPTDTPRPTPEQTARINKVSIRYYRAAWAIAAASWLTVAAAVICTSWQLLALGALGAVPFIACLGIGTAARTIAKPRP